MALDAALNSTSAAAALAEALDAHEAIKQAIFGIMGAVGAARILIAEQVEPHDSPNVDADGNCVHPEGKIQERPVGSTKVKFCGLCGEILEQ